MTHIARRLRLDHPIPRTTTNPAGNPRVGGPAPDVPNNTSRMPISIRHQIIDDEEDDAALPGTARPTGPQWRSGARRRLPEWAVVCAPYATPSDRCRPR